MQQPEPYPLFYPFMLFDSLTEGVTIVDTAWRFIYVNNTAAQIMGGPREELLGKNMWEFLPEAVETVSYTHAQRAVEQKTAVHFEVYYPLLQTWFECHLYPNPRGLLILLQDISERKALEQRKDDFISMVSHELKTPITTLKGLTQLLRRKLEQQAMPEQVSILNKMDAQISRLDKLIDEFLNVSKIQVGRLDYEKEPVDIDALVHETVELLQATTPTHVLNVSGATQAVIVGDKDRLSQVLINLITNAVKYFPEANRVDIVLTNSQKSASIAMRDSGVGIPKASQMHIFERFYRVYGEREKAFPGLGMGLYITSEIVK